MSYLKAQSDVALYNWYKIESTFADYLSFVEVAFAFR